MKEIIQFLIFAIMLFWETKSPLFPVRNDRWQHATRNIGIKLFNIQFGEWEKIPHLLGGDFSLTLKLVE